MRSFPATEVLLFALVLFPGIASYASGELQEARSSSSERAPLEVGKTVERAISTGEKHEYEIRLEKGQCLVLVADQFGIDIVLTVLGPGGTELAATDMAPGIDGTERLWAVAPFAGVYRVEIQPAEPKLPAGRYSLTAAVRATTATDESRLSAQAANWEAHKLQLQETPDSRRKAIAKYEEAVGHWHAAGETDREAETLNHIAAVQLSLGRLRQALDYYEKSYGATENETSRVTNLINLGAVNYFLGELSQAEKYYLRALPSLERNRDAMLAVGLNNLGLVYSALGAYQKALDYFSRALELRREFKDRRGEGITLNNLAMVLWQVGNLNQSLDSLTQALRIRREIQDRPGEAASLTNISRLYADMGKPGEAVEAGSEALALFRALGDRYGEAMALSHLGSAERERDATRSRELLEQALSIFREIGDKWSEAITLTSLGATESRQQEFDRAFQHLQAALALHRATGDRRTEATTLYEIARVEKAQGRLSTARQRVEEAIHIMEKLRGGLTSPQTRSFLLSSSAPLYELEINVLMAMHRADPSGGFDVMALLTSERGRARSFVELLAEAHAEIRQGIPAESLARERSLRDRLSFKSEQQVQLLARKHTEEQLAAVTKELEELTSEYARVEEEILAANPRYATLTRPRIPTVVEIQRELGPDAVLLEYALGEPNSFLWAVTGDSLASHALPGRSEIEALARKVYQALAARNRHPVGEAPAARTRRIAESDADCRETSLALSQMLLGPAAPHLKRRVAVVLDGALQYIPFGALPTPTDTARPLVSSHEVVSFPSGSLLLQLRADLPSRSKPSGTLAVLADPVFGNEDERVVKKSARSARGSTSRGLSGDVLRSTLDVGLESPETVGLPRLPFTRKEALSILALAPRLERLAALDFDASRTTALDPELSRYRYVHFATHGLLDSRHPELSGIVLSLVDRRGEPQAGFLTAADVFNLHLPADLVVLSGCQTALGKEIRGEGLVGLTRAFFYAGAVRVVASLWRVDDVATAELMTRFYNAMLGPKKLSPAQALRTAQLELSSEKRWSAPYYWAGFVLQGDWR